MEKKTRNKDREQFYYGGGQASEGRNHNNRFPLARIKSLTTFRYQKY